MNAILNENAAAISPANKPARALAAMFILAALGFNVALSLVQVHIDANTVAGVDSFCNISAAVSCDVVAQSSWSVFLGLPVAVWGVFFYSFMLVLMAWSASAGGKLTGAIIVITTFSEIFSLSLAAVSLFIIKSLCIMCACSWIINFVMNVLAFRLRAGNDDDDTTKPRLWDMIVADVRYLIGEKKKAAAALAATALLTLGLLWAFYPRYWLAG